MNLSERGQIGMVAPPPTLLTFDCYGTLINWERGILQALQPTLRAHGIELADDALLELYAGIESSLEAGPYLPYRDVLRSAVDKLGQRLGFTPTPTEREILPVSVASWPPFPDTADALQTLSRSFKLAVITNCDNDLFAATAKHFPIRFDEVITAEQVGSYKPSRRNFEVAFERLNVPREQTLHVAQSLFHDIATARELSLRTVWVNRRADIPGSGATPPSTAQPDYEVRDLNGLVKLLEEL